MIYIKKIRNHHGISIFLPDEVWWDLRYSDGTPYRNSFKYIYRDLDFSELTPWVDFIVTLYPDVGGG